jgi:hypothetical protein
MFYSELDPILEPWAKRNSLHVYKLFKDEEVRTIHAVSKLGEIFQLWVTRPIENETSVHAWDFKERKWVKTVPISQLETALDAALVIIKSWMQQVH